jgi:hypothetical protein
MKYSIGLPAYLRESNAFVLTEFDVYLLKKIVDCRIILSAS